MLIFIDKIPLTFKKLFNWYRNSHHLHGTLLSCSIYPQVFLCVFHRIESSISVSCGVGCVYHWALSGAINYIMRVNFD